jgi:tRNA uridine 5-carbamoylmethylation protein Kti12
MSYYVIIRGPLGCGKSTISENLAGLLNAEHICMDRILEENDLDAISRREGCIPSKNFLKANEMIVARAKEKLSKGKIIIFDGCFYHKEQIEDIIRKLKFPHYVFTLKAPLDICIKRDSKRARKYGKEAAIAVHKLVSRFDYGIDIDAAKDMDSILRDIKSHLP